MKADQPHQWIRWPDLGDKRLSTLIGLTNHEVDAEFRRDLDAAANQDQRIIASLFAQVAAYRTVVALQQTLLARAADAVEKAGSRRVTREQLVETDPATGNISRIVEGAP